jgi:hypothetical protein
VATIVVQGENLNGREARRSQRFGFESEESRRAAEIMKHGHSWDFITKNPTKVEL